ncbi:MAG: hypothetical protein RL681_239 [Candidatus Parcubacteria bacterium]|jgi:hypothetical protein
MQQEQIAKIFTQLADHEARLKQLEDGAPTAPFLAVGGSRKQKTLREIVKGKKFKNGQEQIAAIVWYHEKVLGQRISKEQIKEEWVNAKMSGNFSPVYFSRAKDVLIRVHSDGTCDLTQSEEERLDHLLNNEPSSATSK